MMLIPLLISSLLSAAPLVLTPGEDIEYSEKDSDYYPYPTRSHEVHPCSFSYQGIYPPLPLQKPQSAVSHTYLPPFSKDSSHLGYPLPIASIVGISDTESKTEMLSLGRNVSVTSNMTDSQPFSQEEIGSPCFKTHLSPSPTTWIEDSVVESLYLSIKEKPAEIESFEALKMIAINGNCSAKLAIFVLSQEGFSDFGMTKGEIREMFNATFPTFLKSKTSCPAHFAVWHPRLKPYALIRE